MIRTHQLPIPKSTDEVPIFINTHASSFGDGANKQLLVITNGLSVVYEVHDHNRTMYQGQSFVTAVKVYNRY